jgi:hypothetical protein
MPAIVQRHPVESRKGTVPFLAEGIYYRPTRETATRLAPRPRCPLAGIERLLRRLGNLRFPRARLGKNRRAFACSFPAIRYAYRHAMAFQSTRVASPADDSYRIPTES